MTLKFILTIENYDPSPEQLEEQIADALDGCPALDDAQPIVVSVEPVNEAEEQRQVEVARTARRIVEKQTALLEALHAKLTEALELYPKV